MIDAQRQLNVLIALACAGLLAICFAGCATMTTIQTDPGGGRIEFKGRALGKANIDNLKAEYSQTALADGSIKTTIGQSSDSLKSENDQLIGNVIQGAVRGAVEAMGMYMTRPPPLTPTAPAMGIPAIPSLEDTTNNPTALELLIRDRLGGL